LKRSSAKPFGQLKTHVFAHHEECRAQNRFFSRVPQTGNP